MSRQLAVERVAEVEARSARLRKELGLVDLVLMQIMYVVGAGWVGSAPLSASRSPSRTSFAVAWVGVAIVSSPLGNSLVYLFVPMAARPTIACLVLDGTRGYHNPLARLVRWRVSVRWYMIALLLAPLSILSILQLLALADPLFTPGIFVSGDRAALIKFVAAAGLLAVLFEEIGWTG